MPNKLKERNPELFNAAVKQHIGNQISYESRQEGYQPNAPHQKIIEDVHNQVFKSNDISKQSVTQISQNVDQSIKTALSQTNHKMAQPSPQSLTKPSNVEIKKSENNAASAQNQVSSSSKWVSGKIVSQTIASNRNSEAANKNTFNNGNKPLIDIDKYVKNYNSYRRPQVSSQSSNLSPTQTPKVSNAKKPGIQI